MQNIKIKISGKVYKVGFRYYIKQMAELLGVFGTIKYTKKQAIIIEASGKSSAINQFLVYCNLGCHGSIVNKVSISKNQMEYHNNFLILSDDSKKNKDQGPQQNNNQTISH